MSTTSNKKELIIGLAMIGVSLTYMVLAYQLPGHDGVDAGTLPTLMAGLLTLLGAMQLLGALPKKPRCLYRPCNRKPVICLKSPRKKAASLKSSNRKP